MKRIFLILLVVFPAFVYGHGGGLDDNGCHNNRTVTPAVYECHSGEFAGTSWESLDAFLARDSVPADPVEPEENQESIVFAFPPDWSTLREVQLMFRSEKIWTVRDFFYLYGLKTEIVHGQYKFTPISRAKLKTFEGQEVTQLVQAIRNDQ